MLRKLVLTAIAVVSLATSATGTAHHAKAPAPARHASPAADASSNCANFKPYLGGTLSRQYGVISGRYAANAAKVNGFVIQLDWASVEPSRGQYDFTAIDQELAFAQSHNLRAKLRIDGGVYAPIWAQALGGGSFAYYDHSERKTRTLGRFWTADYQSAWQELQATLAGRYDTNPDLAAVAISGTGTTGAEVMLNFYRDAIPGTSLTNGASMQNAGYTDTARLAALQGDIAFMQRTWPHTLLNLFAHPYQAIDKNQDGLGVTEQIISTAVSNDPGHIVFGHTGLGAQVMNGTSHVDVTTRQMYSWIFVNHYPFDAQTVQLGKSATGLTLGDPAAVLAWASGHPVLDLELPYGWQNWGSDVGIAATNVSLAQHAQDQLGYC